MATPSHVLDAVDRQVALNAVRLRFEREPPVLHVDDDRLDLANIGHGAHADAYRSLRDPDEVYVVAPKWTRAKDVAVAAHRRAPDNPHLPAIDRVGEVRTPIIDRLGRYPLKGDVAHGVYRMPHYIVPPPDGFAADEGRHTLATCGTGASWDDDLVEQGREIAKCARATGVPEALAEAVEILAAEAVRYPSIPFVFEFSPENVGVDPGGDLVLFDVLGELA